MMLRHGSDLLVRRLYDSPQPTNVTAPDVTWVTSGAVEVFRVFRCRYSCHTVRSTTAYGLASVLDGIRCTVTNTRCPVLV